MSGTSSSAQSTSTDFINNPANAGAAQNTSNQSIKTFAASLSAGAIVFGIQIAVFLILSGNWKIRRSKKAAETATERQSLFHKIYYYKTAFVTKRKRIAAPTTAIESFRNIFTISDRELIRIAGVDGYLFLQYLQLLLRIFIPLTIVLLPILLPVNRIDDVPDVSGLDSFAWPNVSVPAKRGRLWAHVILAVVVVLWVCYNFYVALRKFVRLRQTILTVPEHRIRASATTILVQSIPRKWLTVAALDALYDVFPGGIKDIWINRNYDDLMEKVNQRTKIARTLEAAECNLIISCAKKHRKMEEKKAKEEGGKKSKKEKKEETARRNSIIAHDANEHGLSANNPHQIEQTLQAVLEESSSSSSSSSSSRSSSPTRKRGLIPIPIVGQGIHVVGEGIRDVGRFGGKMVGGLTKGFVKHDRQPSHPPSGLDSDQPLSSPATAEFEVRGASSDTYTALNDPSKNAFEQDEKSPTLSSPPDSATKKRPHTAQSTLGPLKPLAKNLKRPFDHGRRMSDFASPQPFRAEGEEFPLETKSDEPIRYNFSGVYDESFVEDDENALWRKYIKPKDRETMRLPIFKLSWWPSIPLIGKKVDTIYHCRKELARLNHEIAFDQANLDRFPLMNSAFIQFNHQVAAHMACQSLSHHIPRQMNPRTVEVNPNEVLWDNLTMSWWVRYVRMFVVTGIIVALIILWGIPVSFTGALSRIEELTKTLKWLRWLLNAPNWLIIFIQGILPPALLAILFALLPIVLRFLAEMTGTTTAGERELLVQNFYFAFVFVQLFLVVSISTGITSTIEELLKNPINAPQTLATNLPKAANYFFSYMILQALSISSGTLLQVGAVIILLSSRFFDTTPRQKVSRVLSRPGINWGTMIPVYTNFGAIGIIYSVLSPLILIMMLITFSMFWVTYRYQMIYVSYAKAETNGLIFPRAINQLFTGLYFMELCLIGLFFLQGKACLPHAIIMIVTGAFTVLFQVLLNRAFGPLFTYLPITFEDEAVERDEEFQRAQASRWKKDEDEHASLTQSLNTELEQREKSERRQSQLMEEEDRRKSKGYLNGSYEMKQLDVSQTRESSQPASESPERSRKKNWADRSRERSRSASAQPNSKPASTDKKHKTKKHVNPIDAVTGVLKAGLDDASRPIRDLETQAAGVLPSANLFDDIDDQLEDIEPEARQKLIKRSFQHPATRAIQPAVWIPHDTIGIARDEIERTAAFSSKIWITSENARLDDDANVLYRGLPPDRDPFENIEV